jgi:hypothetical protein
LDSEENLDTQGDDEEDDQVDTGGDENESGTND